MIAYVILACWSVVQRNNVSFHLLLRQASNDGREPGTRKGAWHPQGSLAPAREPGTRKGAWHPQRSLAPARGATTFHPSIEL